MRQIEPFEEQRPTTPAIKILPVLYKAKLDAEVRKALGLTQGQPQPAAAAAPTNGAAARVTTMPTAAEPVKAPIAK